LTRYRSIRTSNYSSLRGIRRVWKTDATAKDGSPAGRRAQTASDAATSWTAMA